MRSYILNLSPLGRKLWIAWLILGATAFLLIAIGNKQAGLIVATLSAISGWAGFFRG